MNKKLVLSYIDKRYMGCAAWGHAAYRRVVGRVPSRGAIAATKH
jgi:hypothetical protein